MKEQDIGDAVAETGQIYIASRASIPERAALWRKYRNEGIRITSTWIDEAGENQTEDLSELWERIVEEVSRADRLVLYAESEDFPLKGALVEVGVALGLGKPITVCLPGVDLHPRSFGPIGSWVNHPLVARCDNIDQAMRAENCLSINSLITHGPASEKK